MSNKALEPISIDVLVPGMKIDYSIYCKRGPSFILLCKDTVITESFIKRLKDVAKYGENIYVPEGFQRQLLTESNYLRGVQKEFEDRIGYTDVKNETKALIDIISQGDVLPIEAFDKVSESINDRVSAFENYKIVQCINGVRKTDEYLYTHSANVAMLNGLMGKWLGYSPTEISALVKIGLLHDIGKTRIPKEILNKPGKLTDEEFSIIKNHPVFSYEMLMESGETDKDVLAGVRNHHEKMNGNGYPDGLNINTIPDFARITSISDVYDAMVARRVYKDSHSPFEILHQFSVGRFSDLDMNYVNSFLQYMPGELTGKLVIMSTGAIAKVRYVDPQDFTYPIVEIDDDIFVSNSENYCVSMYMERL